MKTCLTGLLVAALLAGCGGGDNGGHDSGTHPDTGSHADVQTGQDVQGGGDDVQGGGDDVQGGMDVQSDMDVQTVDDTAMGMDVVVDDNPMAMDVVGTDRVRTDVASDRVVRDAQDTANSVDCFTSASGAAQSCSGATPVCCAVVITRMGDAGTHFIDTCIPAGGACMAMGTTGETYTCDDSADCTGGHVCCASVTTPDSGSAFLTGSSCAASCGAMERQLCNNDSDCAAGHVCSTRTISGRHYCMM